MKHWQIVFMQELRNQFRRKAYLFSTFGVPLLVVLAVMGYLLYNEVRTENDTEEDTLETEFENEKPVGYVDLSGGFAAPEQDSPFSAYITQYEDFESGEADLKNGSISRLYVIEEDYLDTGRVNLWLESFSATTIDNSLIEAFLLTSLAQDTDPYVISRLRVPTTNVTENRINRGSSETRTGDSEQNFWVAYVFAILLMTTTFSSSGYLMQSVVEEKENLTIEIILTSVKPLALLVGKTLAMALTGLLQTGLWVAALVFATSQLSGQLLDLSNIEIKPMTAVLALVYFLLGFGLVGGFFAAIGSLINSTREGSAYSSVIVLPTIVPLFFISAIAEDPNGTIATVLSLIPLTAPITMMMRVSLIEVPTVQILASIALMLVGIGIAMWLAARLYRVSTLLRGNAPKLRDIPKLIFQS